MASFQVNGTTHHFDGDANTPLLWYLRDELGLLGTKFGCGIALCGACTIHLDGAAVRPCYTAAVIEVAVGEKGEITVPRVDIAVDCGPQVNPDRIRSQLEGAVIMGLSVAMGGGITFKNGRVEQSNFHQYMVLRMNEAPRDIRVHIVPASYDIPLGGVGEPGLPPIAPALCNAIFAATGKRIRSLPITDDAAATNGS